MINLSDLKSRLKLMVGMEIDPSRRIYDYSYYSTYSSSSAIKDISPVEGLLCSVIVDLDSLNSKIKDISYFPVGYFTYRFLCQYYGSSKSDIIKGVQDVISLLDDLDINRLGIRIIRNYSGSTQHLARLLELFSQFNWIPENYDSDLSRIVLKKINSKN